DGGDPLADEAHDVVENIGVVWVDQMILVQRGAVEPAWNVLPGEDPDHARHRHGLVASDGEDARVGVRRAQHLEVQKPLDGHVHGVARPAGDDAFGERVRDAGTAGLAGNVLLDFSYAGKRVVDRPIAGTPA